MGCREVGATEGEQFPRLIQNYGSISEVRNKFRDCTVRTAVLGMKQKPWHRRRWVKIIIIIIYCNWAFTRWQYSYTSTDKNKNNTKQQNNRKQQR
jgi:hypothetical protein